MHPCCVPRAVLVNGPATGLLTPRGSQMSDHTRLLLFFPSATSSPTPTLSLLLFSRPPGTTSEKTNVSSYSIRE